MDDRDPLRPIEAASRILLVSLAGWLLAATVPAVLRPLEFRGLGQGDVCATTAGIGLLTVARVLRIAVSMREDLDATI